MILADDSEFQEVSVTALPAVSVQLYSIREALADDLTAALARLAALGLSRVEPFDITADPRGLREALDASGLSAPSAHARLDAGELDRIFEAAATVGVQTVIHPYSPPERWTSREGVDAVADELVGALDRAAGFGLRLGYHNHHWELAALLDGRTALERFAEQLGEAMVLELDTYWAAVAGQDVPALLGRLGDRVRMLHLKDGPVNADNAAQMPLGSGAMPVPEILAAATAVELAVLEFDDYAGDMFEGIATGYGYLTGMADR